MGGSGRDDARREGTFPGERNLSAPGDAVVVASGRAIPVGVEAVIRGTVACRLVLGDGLCTRGERFEIGGGPVQEVPHRLVGLLVQRRGDVEVRTLKDGIVPGCWTPFF